MAQTQNNVVLDGYFGNDLDCARAAWTSTNRDVTEDKKARVGKLLTMLASDHHLTPFEHTYLRFLVDCETASHVHLLKHRIGVSINGESARYKELKADKYHIPRDWHAEEQQALLAHCEESFAKYHACLARLQAGGMDRKRAKESARFYLPYANSLTLCVSMNLRSFFHFQFLRNSEHAQLEIREIAQRMLQLVKDSGAFPLTIEAFGY